MRIVQLAPVWETVPPPGYGGTEAVVSVLTEELVRRGHEVLLCASGDSKTSAELFSVVPESLRRAGLTNHPAQYAAVHVAASLKQAEGFDIIHNHNGPPFDLAMAMSCLTPTPMLTTLHNQPFEDTCFTWDQYRLWYNTISRQQALTVSALPCARFAGAVHNGIDVPSFPFSADKDDYAFFMARISPEKAPHLAIEAALKAGSRIVLAGKISTSDEHEYFEAKVRPLLALSGVDYVGEADYMLKRELYANARVQLVPLLWDEPFGLVMIEAMACGTPVIAFNRGAASELIADGVTGFLVDDVDAMARALEFLGEIQPERCRAHVESNFSAQALADNYLAVYEKILSEPGVPLDDAA
jgi:glycosyltransferase involved in cell wall biosynthesis